MLIYNENYFVSNSLYALIGRNIKYLRKSTGMTQEQLADKIGVDQKQVSRIEGGHARAKLPTYLQIANVFGVSIDYFLANALLPDAKNTPHLGLADVVAEQLFRDVIYATLRYLKGKET